jgi:inosose dehydratase
VRDALHESGYDGWLLVELDSYAGAPGEAAAVSKTFLDHLLAASGAAASHHHHGEAR